MVKINPPYFAPGWLESFFDLVRRVRLEKVDRHLFERYKICSAANGSKVVSGLKFLKLIDENGKVMEENLKGLKLEGESNKNELKRIVSEAYSELMSEVDLSIAKNEDLMNYFIEHFNYSPLQAKLASRMFLYLTRKAGIELSKELSKPAGESKKGRPLGSKTKNENSQFSIKQNKVTKKVEVPSFENSHGISIHIRGKGVTLDLIIKEKAEIKPNLDIISQILLLNLRDGKKEDSEEE
jgi:hypothetical protein